MTMEELNKLAISELDKNDWETAKKHFKLNVKINPSYITYNNLAWCYFDEHGFRYNLRELKKPIKYCMKALKLESNISSLRLLRYIKYLKKD